MDIKDRTIEGFPMKYIESDPYILGITTEIGPRILFLGHKDKPGLNMMGILPKEGRETPEGFRFGYGGHRLWVAPEALPRSYSLDNKPVEILFNDKTITLIGNTEPANSIQKKIMIDLSSINQITLTHKITNIGRWPIKAACWPITEMRENGFSIIPIKPAKVDEYGLLPDRRLSIWPYTDLSDPRISFTANYIFIKQDTKATTRFKIGTMAQPAWIAYWLDGMLFLKKFEALSGEYPDYGCNVEVFTNQEKLELETVGPLKIINPNESIDHVERWFLRVIGDLKPVPEMIAEKVELFI